MRILVTAAVLLAVVSTAMVAVCQHSETRRLQHRVWQLERRRERLERTRRRLVAAIEAARTPRRLLSELDGRPTQPLVQPAQPAHPGRASSTYEPADSAPRARNGAPAVPAGFVVGNNFEGGTR